MNRKDVEIWQNASVGSVWVRKLTPQGQEKASVIKGKKSFTVTPFERQINQALSAEPEMDIFRNGTVILIRAAEDTDEREIDGPNALTDGEIALLVRETLVDPKSIRAPLKKITSVVTLDRLLEELFLEEDAPHEAVEAVKAAIENKREIAVNPVETVG